MTDRAFPDQNNNFSLFAVSNADGVTPVSLWADPVTHLLQVSGGGSGGNVTIVGNLLVTAPLVGQSKVTVTATAVNLNGGTTQPLSNGIIITAAPSNATVISIGSSTVNNTTGGTGNGYLLQAGASISFAVTNTNDIWINGTSGDYVSWAGS